MDHATLRELTAGAALEDLDPTERADLGVHLATCLECQALTHDLGEVLGELALLAPDVEPPAALRGRVLRALDAPPPLDGLAPSPRPEPVGRPRPARMSLIASLGLAAALGIVAVGLGARTIQLDRELETATAAVIAAEARLAARDAAMAVVADPRHVTASLHGEAVAPEARSVVVFRPGTEDAYLMATDLPATPPGHVYQLWYADDTGVHALGTFHHDGTGPFVAPFGVDLAGSAAAMVTLEPEGGAQGAPGPEVVFGEL